MHRHNGTATVMDAVSVPSPAVLAVLVASPSAVDRSIVDFRILDLVDPLSTEGFLVARSRRTVRTTAAVSVEAASEVSATKKV